jgi:hypothetical protein
MLPKASIKGKTLRKKKEAVCSDTIKQQKGFDSIICQSLFLLSKNLQILRVISSGKAT